MIQWIDNQDFFDIVLRNTIIPQFMNTSVSQQNCVSVSKLYVRERTRQWPFSPHTWNELSSWTEVALY